MKKNITGMIHAAVILLAAALTAVSSAMAYPLGDLVTILLFSTGIVLLDVLMLFILKKDSVLRDLCMLISVVLATMCLCRVLNGRSDLMGYVWFSDLEKGNQAAVTSLNLATGAMGCYMVGCLMQIVSGFRKRM